MVKEKNSPHLPKNTLLLIIYLMVGILLTITLTTVAGAYIFEKTYYQKIYPGIRVDGIAFGGKKPVEIEKYFAQKSEPFKDFKLIFNFEDKIATISGQDLGVEYDGKLSAAQSYSIGRSGHLLSDTYQKWKAVTAGINLPSVLKMNNDLLDESLNRLADSIDYASEDALFQFENGKVTIFRLSKTGRALDKKMAKQMAYSYLNSFTIEGSFRQKEFTVNLPVNDVQPKIKTEDSNNYGIRELIATGQSKFVGSIPGRAHNIELAASKINGHLVAPGAVFSFNDTLGDVSAATGFVPAYIIKDGRTVLGDGGGICQVSTTLFRAALNAGLPITERHAHAYRVGYYEQDSLAGIDATVFAPSYDLKFKNDTGNYILIQSKVDTQNYTMKFEIFGTKDGRQTELTKPTIGSQIAPPPDLYQDDPTLAKGIVKQVDWSAWGAKVNFDYKVTRNGQVINRQSFFSDFQPWQAVYLRGTKT